VQWRAQEDSRCVNFRRVYPVPEANPRHAELTAMYETIAAVAKGATGVATTASQQSRLAELRQEREAKAHAQARQAAKVEAVQGAAAPKGPTPPPVGAEARAKPRSTSFRVARGPSTTATRQPPSAGEGQPSAGATPTPPGAAAAAKHAALADQIERHRRRMEAGPRSYRRQPPAVAAAAPLELAAPASAAADGGAEHDLQTFVNPLLIVRGMLPETVAATAAHGRAFQFAAVPPSVSGGLLRTAATTLCPLGTGPQPPRPLHVGGAPSGRCGSLDAISETLVASTASMLGARRRTG
jgi:hypothetical protein